jgi:hypothetical protein
MIPAFAKKQLLSALQVKVGIAPNTLTTGQSINTYDASPQPASGIDSWDGGKGLFRNMLVIVNLASITTGSLAVSLYDSKTAMTTGSHTGATLAFTLGSMTVAGLYVTEIRFADHIFASTIDRVVAEPLACEVMRYHNIRATATGGTNVFSVTLIYGNTLRGFPKQTGYTQSTVTFNTTTS